MYSLSDIARRQTLQRTPGPLAFQSFGYSSKSSLRLGYRNCVGDLSVETEQRSTPCSMHFDWL